MAFKRHMLKSWIFILMAALIAVSLVVPATRAQGPTAKRPAAGKAQTGKKSAREAARDEAQTARNELLKAAKEYKTSLQQLLTFYEKGVTEAEAQRDKLKPLYADGLVSRLQLEESERAIAAAQRKVDEVKGQITSADKMVSEALVEVELAPQLSQPSLNPSSKLTNTVAYVRSTGTGSWSLSEAWKIQSFFKEKFGVALPVSTFGQSQLHDRWGLDHRNAMDVGLNPDSPQGQALMAYLRANGIPFTAFRVAIQGSSTGPHFHIGTPSRRTFSWTPGR